MGDRGAVSLASGAYVEDCHEPRGNSDGSDSHLATVGEEYEGDVK